LGGCDVIASHILIQAEVGPAAVMTAARQEVPGVSEAASVVGRCDAIARAGTRDTGERARPVTSRARAAGAGTRTVSCPVVRQ
jgi:hypothetical protein